MYGGPAEAYLAPLHCPSIYQAPVQRQPSTSSQKSFKMVYTIVVHLYAREGDENISRLSAKLIEASRVYSQDKETLSWFVMQDTKDPRAFTIVERYEQESVS